MAKFWEIVQLTDKTFALKSSEEAEAPMVEIKFSAEAESMLQGQLPEIARAMISAGVQSASMIEEEYELEDEEVDSTPIVH